MKKNRNQRAKILAQTTDGRLFKMCFDADDNDFKIVHYGGFVYVRRGKNEENIAVFPNDKLVYIVRSSR